MQMNAAGAACRGPRAPQARTSSLACAVIRGPWIASLLLAAISSLAAPAAALSGVPAGLRLRGGADVAPPIEAVIEAVPANPCKIFIGNLPRFANMTSISTLLGPYGQAEVDIKKHPKYPESCKGFALATFQSSEEATAAVQALSGSFFLGRSLLVKPDIGVDPDAIMEKRKKREEAIAKAQERKDQGIAPRRRPTMGARDFWPRASEQGTRVYVGNIRWGTTWQMVRDHMTSAGRVEFGRIIKKEIDGADGQKRWVSRGFAIVQFSTAAEASQAIENLNGSELNGRQVYVKPDTQGRPRKEGQEA
jgi:RNA recognition motif-containing protein